MRDREGEIFGNLPGMLQIIDTRRINLGVEGVQGLKLILKVD